MSKVIAEITMSLDGFVAGPNATLEQPLGKAANGSTTGPSSLQRGASGTARREAGKTPTPSAWRGPSRRPAPS